MGVLEKHFPVKERKQSCLFRWWPYILLIVAIVALCLMCFIKLMALDWIVDQQISQKLRLVPGTDTFEKWKEVPIPIIIKFRFFNVTNPAEFQNGGKPKLVEAGPYSYEEKRVKDVIGMDTERDAIVYRQRIFYKFRPDLSNGSESDRLVIINVPFVTLSKMTYDNVGNFSFAHALADRNMRQRGERLFTYATVKEYLFDGYPVQHYLNFLRSPALQLVGGVKIPSSISSGRFGFYRGKNGSDDGEYVIRTGKSNSHEIGQIISWNGKTKLDYYSGTCNLINGTDGSLVPPFLTKDSRIRFFSSDICRSLFATYREETEVKGIKTYRFKTPNGKSAFEHKDFCFCPTGNNNECYKHGVLSMAPCREGAPISMSSAHFLHAYEDYQDGVEGLHPDPNIHETFLDIEPKTGLILRAAKRLQFNVMVKNNRDMITFSQIRTTLFPFMWVEETVEATDEFLMDLQNQLFRPVEMANMATSGGFIFCAILFILGSLGIISNCSSDRKRRSSRSVASDNSNSFHADSSRASSRSRTASIASSRSLGHGSEHSTTRTIRSVTSRGTMTAGEEGRDAMTAVETNRAMQLSSDIGIGPQSDSSFWKMQDISIATLQEKDKDHEEYVSNSRN